MSAESPPETPSLATALEGLRALVGSFVCERVRSRGSTREERTVGNHLHSVLGATLRETACRRESGICAGSCEQGRSCAVGVLLECSPRAGATHQSGQSRIPNPLILRPHAPFVLGAERIHFEVLLLGDARRHRDQVTSALVRGLAGGSVAVPVSYVPRTIAWRETGAPELAPAGSAPHSLRLHLLTPLRLLSAGRLLGQFSLEAVARDLCFKAAVWAHHHQRAPWFALPPAIPEQVAVAHVANNTTGLTRAGRYSRRHHRMLPQDGLVGTVELYGVRSDLLRLLGLAEIVGIGKGATTGLGVVAVELL